jgi:hypothetical protein
MDQMIDLMLSNQVYYDPNIQMYGGIDLRRELGADMIWTDESQYFTPYAQNLLKVRGDPPPESEPPAFKQRLVELKAFYQKVEKILFWWVLMSQYIPLYYLVLHTIESYTRWFMLEYRTCRL